MRNKITFQSYFNKLYLLRNIPCTLQTTFKRSCIQRRFNVLCQLGDETATKLKRAIVPLLIRYFLSKMTFECLYVHSLL